MKQVSKKNMKKIESKYKGAEDIFNKGAEDIFKPKKANWAAVLPKYWDRVKNQLYVLSECSEDYYEYALSVGEEQADHGIPYNFQAQELLEYANFFALYNQDDLKNLRQEYKEYKKYSSSSLYDIDGVEMVDPDETDTYDEHFMLANISEFMDLENYPAIDTLYSFYKCGFQNFSFADEMSEREYENNFDGFVKSFISEQNEKFDYLKAQKEAKKAAANKQPVVATTPVKTIADVVKGNTGRE